MNNPKILLVEDEERISKIEASYLERAGFDVILARNGEEAIDLFHQYSITLIVLDLMIPKISGEEVLQIIRQDSDVPIIIVSAKVEEDNRIQGLQLGADDYLCKPFSPREMVERIHAVLRRFKKQNAEEILTSDDGRLFIYPERTEVKKDGKSIHLTKNEFFILNTLLSHPGKTYTRDEIIEKIFGADYDSFDRSIDTHIKNIRQKIEDDPRKPLYVKTVYGIGYKAGGFDASKR